MVFLGSFVGVVVVGAGRDADERAGTGRRPPAAGGIGSRGSPVREGLCSKRVNGALLCFACWLDASRRPAGVRARAASPVDGSSLAVLRIALGAVGLLSAARIVAYGWIDSLYAGPSHRFTYLGFGWVPQPTSSQMGGLVVLLAVASAALVVGWRCRWAAAGLLVSLGWIELIDATTYLNHYWFLTLVAALAVVAPLGRALSLDARRAGGPATVARGWVWLFRFQVGVVYAFAGLAKLQPDWLVHALPLELWLPARAGCAGARPRGRDRRRCRTRSRSRVRRSTASSCRCSCGAGRDVGRGLRSSRSTCARGRCSRSGSSRG